MLARKYDQQMSEGSALAFALRVLHGHLTSAQQFCSTQHAQFIEHCRSKAVNTSDHIHVQHKWRAWLDEHGTADYQYFWGVIDQHHRQVAALCCLHYSPRQDFQSRFRD